MANYVQMRPVLALLATILLCLPSPSVRARVIGTTGPALTTTESGFSTFTSPVSRTAVTTTESGYSTPMSGTAVTTTTTESGYSTIASPMSEYCATDFSQVSYADVQAACPADILATSAACCAAFNAKACEYEEQVNDFGGLCPMLFMSYLGAAGPYPAGHFVGPCGDGLKGLCIRA